MVAEQASNEQAPAGASSSVEPPAVPKTVRPRRPLEEANAEQKLDGDTAGSGAGAVHKKQSIAEMCGHKQRTRDPRVAWAMAAAVAVMFVVGGSLFVWTRSRQPLEWNMNKILALQESQRPKDADVARWLADLKAAEKRPALSSDARLVASLKPVHPPELSGAAPAATGRPRKAKRVPVEAMAVAPQATLEVVEEDRVDPLYAQRYGSAARVAASSGRSSRIAASAAKSGTKRVNLRGTEVNARLLDEISSDQLGSPVKAILTDPVNLASVFLPQNTGLEGKVTGGSDARVYVSFDLARTPDGGVLRIDAIARDRQKGTSGIEGHRRLTRETAKSIGLAGIGRILSSGGRIVGGGVGEVVGDGVGAMADSSVQATRRLDRDQPDRVVASQGAPFKLYINSVFQDDE